MFRFLRQFREGLLTESKFSRYLLYAFGEIALVVIGILLALWVSDWNEGQKDRDKRDALLQALSVEFHANLLQLDSVMYFNERVIEASRKFIALRSGQVPTTPTDTLRDWLWNTSWLWTFDPRNGALRSGISSGDIHLIESDSLINLLFSWQDVVVDAGENEARHIDLQLGAGAIVAPYVRTLDYYDVIYTDFGKSSFPSDYQGLVRDPLFEDYVTELYAHTVDARNELSQVRKQNIKIMQLIAHEQNSGK